MSDTLAELVKAYEAKKITYERANEERTSFQAQLTKYEADRKEAKAETDRDQKRQDNELKSYKTNNNLPDKAYNKLKDSVKASNLSALETELSTLNV